jgi:hypothetical protein
VADDLKGSALSRSDQTVVDALDPTTSNRTRARAHQRIAWVAAGLAIISTACIITLNVAKSSFTLVVVGPFHGSQLTVLAWAIASLSVGALLLLARKLIKFHHRWLNATLKSFVSIVVVSGWGLGALAGFWVLALSTTSSVVALDSHGHGNYVALVTTLHHTDVNLYEGNGIFYRPVNRSSGSVPLDINPFSGGDYFISADGDAVMLHFAMTPGGPQNRQLRLK